MAGEAGLDPCNAQHCRAVALCPRSYVYVRVNHAGKVMSGSSIVWRVLRNRGARHLSARCVCMYLVFQRQNGHRDTLDKHSCLDRAYQ